jgi:hypothetical protein
MPNRGQFETTNNWVVAGAGSIDLLGYKAKPTMSSTKPTANRASGILKGFNFGRFAAAVNGGFLPCGLGAGVPGAALLGSSGAGIGGTETGPSALGP